MDAAVVRVRSVAWFATAVVLSVVCTLLVTQAWSVGAAPGDSDSTFVPTAGCRLADTRPAPRTVGPRSAPLGAGGIFEVTVRGSNGRCTGGLAIPSDAVGVALNVTAVNATASSNIRLYPANLTSVPTLSNLNVTAGAPPTPNKVDVKLSPDGKLRVFNANGSVNVILDVVGYYTNSTLKELSQRVASLEAAQAAGVDPALLARIAALEAATAALNAAQPFTVVSARIFGVTARATPTAVRSVTVTAPVDGQVATIATGFITEFTEGQVVVCGLMDSVRNPPVGDDLLWRSPITNGAGHLSGSRVFDLAAGQTATYYLVCSNQSNGTTEIGSPRVTAIFTPSP